MSEPNKPSGQSSQNPSSPTGEATPTPQSIGGPPMLSPLPPSSSKGWVPEGLNPSDAEMLSKRSVAFQDLSADKILLAAPRSTFDGRAVPTLGGIPMLAKLGQGGMGAVYYGIHPRLQKEVAVKVLPFLLAEQQPDLVQRFYREARIAARVQSPHLVGVLDVNEENGLFFLVMEYVHGETGKRYLMRINEMGKQGLEETVALEICAAAAHGLAAAHAENIVHRDVKPDNILLPWAREGDRLLFTASKLSDLGLARGEDLHQSLTGTQSAMGTPGYMAPEQVMDAHSAGVRADVFSLGATLYALLTGRAPFVGTSITKVIFDTVQAPHVPVTQLRTDLSPATQSVIERCLRKNPAERFANGKELQEALQACREIMGEPEPTVRGSLPFRPETPVAAPALTPITNPIPPVMAGPVATPVQIAAPAYTPASAYTPVPPPAAASQRMQPPIPTDLPQFTPLPAPVAGIPALPAVAPAPVPAKRGSGALVAAAVVLLLAGGGYGAFYWHDMKSREEAIESRRIEIAEAVKSARGKTADEKALTDALSLLDRVESKYKDAPEADLSTLRALKTDLKTLNGQKKVEREAAEALEKGKDGDELDGVLARLGELETQFKNERGVDVAKLTDAKKQLTVLRNRLQQRQQNFQNALSDADRFLKDDPAAAVAKLELAGQIGAADKAQGLPDLLGTLHPDLAERKKQALAAKETYDKKMEAAEKERKDREHREKFSRDLGHAQKAFYDQKNLVLAEASLTEALKALGDLTHPDKDSANALYETIKLERQKQNDFGEFQAKGDAALALKNYAEAKTAYQKALELWPAAPQKDRVLAGLKDADEALSKQSQEQNLTEARKLLQQQKFSEAADAYTRILDQQPRHAEATKGLSEAVYGGAIKSGNEALTQHRWPEAERAFAQALKELGGDPVAQKGVVEARYGAAMQDAGAAIRARAWMKAKALYDQAGREKPGDTEALRGSQNAQLAQAQQIYAEAVAEGRRLLSAGDNSTAAAAFKRALEQISTGREAAEGLAAANGVKITFDAKSEWRDSGVRVKTGDKVKVTAAGQWKSFHLGKFADASGKGGSPTGRMLNKDGDNHEFFSETLIARVMTAAAAEPPKRVGLLAPPPPPGPPPFYIGKETEFTAASDGALQFRMNEENALLANPLYDNEGSLEITIRVIPASLSSAPAVIPPPVPAPVEPKVVVEPPAPTPVPVQTPAAADGSYGAYEALGTFGVYANIPGQGVPLDKNNRVLPIRTDLDKEQYQDALKDRKSVLTIEKGTKVKIEATGKWFSGPTGAWVTADGRHDDGHYSVKQFRAFKGASDEFNIATLVVFVSDKEKNATEDFAKIQQAGQVWGCLDKDKPIEFVMPVTGTLRMQQNRDGYYDVTQGGLNVTISLAKPKPRK